MIINAKKRLQAAPLPNILDVRKLEEDSFVDEDDLDTNPVYKKIKSAGKKYGYDVDIYYYLRGTIARLNVKISPIKDDSYGGFPDIGYNDREGFYVMGSSYHVREEDMDTFIKDIQDACNLIKFINAIDPKDIPIAK